MLLLKYTDEIIASTCRPAVISGTNVPGKTKDELLKTDIADVTILQNKLSLPAAKYR